MLYGANPNHSGILAIYRYDDYSKNMSRQTIVRAISVTVPLWVGSDSVKQDSTVDGYRPQKVIFVDLSLLQFLSLAFPL